MRYVDYHKSSGECFIAEGKKPIVSAEHALCKVHSFGINRADLLQKQGKYPPPVDASEILGMEIAGVVCDVASDQHKHWIGTAVCAMVSGGAYAEYISVPIDHLIPVAKKLKLEEAAAVPEVFLTAYQALFSIANLKPEERVLVHAGASGVGTAAIQLVKAWGAQVAVTCSSKRKVQACLSIGADIAINYSEQDFVTELKQQGFFPDVIIDVVGEGNLQGNLNIAAMDCRIVQLAMLGGRYVQNLDMAKLLRKRIRWQASTLRNRQDSYKTELLRNFQRDFGEQLLNGTIKPVIDTVYSVEDINEAHQYMAQNRNIGKLVVKW